MNYLNKVCILLPTSSGVFLRSAISPLSTVITQAVAFYMPQRKHSHLSKLFPLHLL